MGVALALASMVCFAANMLIARFAVTRMHTDSGFFIVLAVNILSGGALFAAELALRSTPFEFRWQPALWFILGGVLGAWMGRRVLLDAVRLLGPARASVMHSCAPVPTLLFAWLAVGEMLGAYELALMAMVLVGLWITHPPARDATVSSADRQALRRGALFGAIAITGFGASNTVRGMAMRAWDEAFFGALIGAAAALVLQIVTTRDWSRIVRGFREAQPGGMLLFAASGFATLGGAVFLITATLHMEIALATLITHTTPLVVFPVSYFILRNREQLTPRTFAGVTLVLLGIALLALR